MSNNETRKAREGWLVQTRRHVFRRIAMYAINRSGPGYREAVATALSAHRFFAADASEGASRVYMELSDSVREMPNIAHLAVRGALADRRPDVVAAGNVVLAQQPALVERVNDGGRVVLERGLPDDSGE